MRHINYFSRHKQRDRGQITGTTITDYNKYITENEQHGEITEVFVSLVGPSLAALSTRSRGFSKYPLRLGNGRSVRLA